MTDAERIQLIRKKVFEKCRDDIEYFIDNYGHIEIKDAPELINPFKMWKEQREALHSIMENKLNAILKARQLGFSWLMLHIAAWYCVLFSGRTVIGMSRSEEEAKELVRRLGVILRAMPELIAEKDFAPPGWTGPIFRVTAMELTVYFPDEPESKFKAFPSNPNAARSFTADLLIFDEWAFQQFANEIWSAAFPTINRPMGGKVIGLSTIERGSLFEVIFTDPDNGFNKIFVPWYADPSRDAEWYEKTKRALAMAGKDITAEYPATIEEALTVPGGAFFPEVRDSIHSTSKEMTGKVSRYVCIDYGLDMLSAHWITVDTAGRAQIYREFDSPNLVIGAACDAMLSLTGDEHIDLWLAPPDLWNRSQESGKSRAILFSEFGINLTKTSNDFPAGCAAIKEWLYVSDEVLEPKLTILEDCAPNLLRNLKKIQKDKKRPNVYAKEPHDLTHDIDSLRCFCIWWVTKTIDIAGRNRKKWTDDMWEDYNNASSEEDRRYIVKKYGEPC